MIFHAVNGAFTYNLHVTVRHPVLKLSNQVGHLGAVTTQNCMHWHPLLLGEGFTME